jgi:hypothetical protein
MFAGTLETEPIENYRSTEACCIPAPGRADLLYMKGNFWQKLSTTTTNYCSTTLNLPQENGKNMTYECSPHSRNF